MRFTRHPGERLLNRFADGELRERDHARVAAHLARCPRCREEVSITRRLGDAARSLPAPLATDEILRRALERRRGGERVLLPMSDAGAPRTPRVNRMLPAAAAALVTLMVASLILSVRVLEADRPALRFHPERPTAGEALRVDYSGGARFTGETHLALRARYRTADDRHWQLLAGVLVRGDDGLYRTELQLPDSVVYAAFAVEDLHGRQVDSNNRELWDLMIHGDDGRPTLDAMTARTWDLERRDWGEAYAQTLRMTEAYPDEPQAWAARFSYELSLFDRDSIFAAHRAHFDRLEERLAATPDPDPSAMAWLGMYAVDLGLHTDAEAWIGKAWQSAPTEWSAVTAKSMLVQILPDNPLRKLSELNALWSGAGGRHVRVAQAGWRLANAVSDTDGMRLWADRWLAVQPSDEMSLLVSIYGNTAGRADLVNRIRELREDPGAWRELHRPLHRTHAAHVRFESRRLQRAAAEVAWAATREGDRGLAVELASLTTDLSWESFALLKLADVLEEAGLHQKAIDPSARLAADPTIDAPAFHNVANWETRVAEARSNLLTYVMEAGLVRYLPEQVMNALSIAEDSGRPTVVVLLSRYCSPALADANGVASLKRELDRLGADLIVVSIDSDARLEAYLAENGYQGPVHRDARGTIRTAFQSSATADYFVMDGSRRVRFEHSQRDEILRQVWALKATGSGHTVLYSD